MAFGRLERTVGEPPMSEINVTPLVDVMLVLVVIFIITGAAAGQLHPPRPAESRGHPVGGRAALRDRGGSPPKGGLFLNDQPVTQVQLAEQLAAAAKQNPDIRNPATARSGRSLRQGGGGDGRRAQGRFSSASGVRGGASEAMTATNGE
jgi:hypothetical protein